MTKTIYKKDSKGKIRFLKVFTEGADLVQESGILGTDKPIPHRKTCISKNIGKSNMTSPEEQAVMEAESLIKDKMTEGYFNSISEAEEEEVILPMLAKKYEDEIWKIDYCTPVYIQPKLDGMRCLAIIKNGKVTLKSRDGKIIENMDHIKEELIGLDDQILDGELYTHGYSFQENMRLIKKYRKGETENVKYHIYDMISSDILCDRMEKIKTLIESNNFNFIELVSTKPMMTQSELKGFHIENMKNGYEGSIIRHGNKPYGINKRCDSLLKYKDFQDIDAEIIDIEPAEQRPSWGVPVLKYNGKTFRAGMKFSHEERESWLKNKKDYIGKKANIRFFEWTDDMIPRFPVCVGVHLDR